MLDRSLLRVQNATQSDFFWDVPDYLEVDHNKMSASLARVPEFGEVPYPVMMEPNLVVEFYSR